MKTIILITVILMCSTYSFAADESKVAFQAQYKDGSVATTEGVLTDNDWVNTVTDNTVVATSAISKIKAETSEKEMSIWLRAALSQVQKMRDAVKPYGLIVESFSVNIGVPFSVTVNFKFEESYTKPK